mmetsp:Transcript_94923/g.142194  ORF Transcript_94923/g.142194 Transcript_94923/m.142194 type:complete len:813 (+) Transcript_94923:55-2493(+)|eukprot:CAMPEP_0117033186 /NCGR_PEP_ID=MMETSP0472-20121206/23736_1 /TAXON_ID=693140 ORGANISM="Tiarina fusus, Strain LIS" /NCGR_SAMPLE_ID=MMETSP0472 /ASSEMBLY_ACC=CAM_ASM_000603 /LENGTH=812 /DNA_ID=CAMNT_0004742043 /DNA_START=40 /DNA_END=2478 /DNA_ORIENTATION=-
MAKYLDNEVNLIDLKDGERNDYEEDIGVAEDEEEPTVLDFSDLKLIEDPIAEMSTNALPQTLHDCVGFLKELPLLQPNADQSDPSTIVNMINSYITMPSEASQRSFDGGASNILAQKKTAHSAAFGSLGHTVRPGCISLYKKYDIIYAVPEGRWWLLDPLASWVSKNISLDTNLIKTQDDQVLIIRIIEGQIGLITIQGVHYLLDVGTHVFNTGTVQFAGAVTYADKTYFGHGPYHYVNVPRGKNAKVWAEVVGPDGVKALVPRLIKEGEHFIKSTFFQYKGLVNISDEYIGHDSIHILNVVKGRVAKANCDNLPRLYGEGKHIIESSNFSYEGTVLISPDNLCISHGTITILQVPRGKIALAWNKNEPYLLDRPGLYEFNSNNFHFVGFVDASERRIELGSKKIIQIYTGEVGITYNQGHLKVLDNGRHIIDSSTHVFERFLSTKQRSIRLITYGANHKINSRHAASHKKTHDFTLEDDADFLICETKDLVKVGVRADVFYSIVDPNKCIQTLNTDELEDLVRETAVSTLTNIIRSTALNQIAQSRQISASSQSDVIATDVTAVGVTAEDEPDDDELDQQAAAVTYFFDRAHDEFMSKLHEDFVTRYGVDIANIRMESFKIMDTELANEIAQNCLTTAHVENQLSNLQGQNLIATQKERTQADCEKIKASAEAKSLEVLASAENKRRVDAAKAEAESRKVQTITQAQAEADAIILKAKAEAEAIRMKAVAEAERADLLSQTVLGQQQSLLEIYSDMVKSSNEGVNKVIYMDPSVNRDSPFAMASLDGLNRDLQSLSKLGVAVGESTAETVN